MRHFKWIINHWIELLTSIFLFGFLYYLSMQTPLAGDDWAFYNNTQSNGIFNSAMGMYFGWEGRLATLFAIHSIIDQKWLWNFLNPILYVMIYWASMQIVRPKYRILHSLFFLFVIFSLKDNVRMEVLTWVTGSVYYGLPLLVAFIYFGYHLVSLEKAERRNDVPVILLTSTLAFYLPLAMENIAIGSLIGTIALLVYHYWSKRNIDRTLVINLLAMICGYMIWITSPGSGIRLSQMPDWAALSFFEKIIRNLPALLNYTFYVNKYLILGLSGAMILHNIQYLRKRLWIPINLVYGLAIMFVFSARLSQMFPNVTVLTWMADGYSLLNTMFWIVFAIVFTMNVVWMDIQRREFKLSLILIIVVFTNASLLMSPVIGYRLMIYAVFLLALLVLMVIDQVSIHKTVQILGSIGLMALILMFGRSSYYKYTLVAQIQNERNMILEDYAVYAEFYKDGIWLPRFPIYSIHAGDIEPEDQYHMNAFKVFHNIPLDEEVIFYWKDSY